jgi:hypothetical protein
MWLSAVGANFGKSASGIRQLWFPPQSRAAYPNDLVVEIPEQEQLSIPVDEGVWLGR